MLVAKYETLARVRGERVDELEQILLTLNTAQRTLEDQNESLAAQLRDAEALIGTLFAENKLLKEENRQVQQLRNQLSCERELGEINRAPSTTVPSLFTASWIDRAPTRTKRLAISCQTDHPLNLDKYTQTSVNTIKIENLRSMVFRE